MELLLFLRPDSKKARVCIAVMKVKQKTDDFLRVSMACHKSTVIRNKYACHRQIVAIKYVLNEYAIWRINDSLLVPQNVIRLLS